MRESIGGFPTLFLTVLVAVSVLGGSAAGGGAATGTAAALDVANATEADGTITVEFTDDVRSGSTGGNLSASNFRVWISDPVADRFDEWNESSSKRRIDPGDVRKVAGDEYAIDGEWGDLPPTGEAKIEVRDVRPREGNGTGSTIGNVSVDLSAAVLDEASTRHNTSLRTLRAYSGSPILLHAEADFTPITIQDAETNEVLTEYATGRDSKNHIFDDTSLETGRTYRINFNMLDPRGIVPQPKTDLDVKYVTLEGSNADASLAEDGTTFDHDQNVTLSVRGNADRSTGPAIVEISGQTSVRKRAAWDAEGDLVDSEFDIPAGSLPTGEYTVDVVDVETGLTVDAGNFSVGAPSGTTVARFSGTSFSDARDDVAEIGIDLFGGDQASIAAISIDSTDDGYYETNVTVADEDGDGHVTLRFNTYNAGTNVRERVFWADGSDEVVGWSNESGTFVEAIERQVGGSGGGSGATVDRNESRGRHAVLDAANYTLDVGAPDTKQESADVTGNVTSSIDELPIEDTATLSLSARSLEHSDIWIAPAGDTGRIDLGYLRNRTGGSSMRPPVASEGEVVIFEIKAHGLEGALKNRTRTGEASIERAFIAETSGVEPALWKAAFHRSGFTPDDPRTRPSIPVNATNSDVFADFASDTYYVTLPIEEVPKNDRWLEHGESWSGNFTLEEFDSTDPALSARRGSSSEIGWYFMNASAPLRTADDGTLVVRNDTSQVVPNAGGEDAVTVAPGTVLDLTLEATDVNGETVVRNDTATVRPDHSFAFEFDLRDVGTSDDVAVRLRRDGHSGSIQSVYEGEIRAVPDGRVRLNEQPLDGYDQRITVAFASLEAGGFVAIYENSSDGRVLGVSDSLGAGQHSTVAVSLREAVADGTTLVAVPHRDANGDGVFSFAASDPQTPDGPYAEDGSPISDGATVSVRADPPHFSVSDLFPNTVTVPPDTPITMLGTIENTGGQKATRDVELRVGGTPIASETVTLDAGEDTSVTFKNVDPGASEGGVYTVGIYTENDSMTTTLEVNVPDTDTPAEESTTATPTDASTATPTVTPTDRSTSSPPSTRPTNAPERGTTSGDGPGFGAAVSVFALFAVALVEIGRRD